MRSTPAAAGHLPTFRDPAGSVVLEPARVLRYLSEEGHGALAAFLDSKFAAELVEAGSIVSTRKLGAPGAAAPLAPIVDAHRDFRHVVEHRRIPFVTYPCEWSTEQLFDAASLTLDLAEQALPHGFVLKDATPYNIVFDHARPVFVDIASFARRDPSATAWVAGGQFTRQFLLPLLAHRLGVPRVQDIYLTHRDGMEAAELRSLPGLTKGLRRGYFSLVTAPLLLERFSGSGPIKPKWEPQAASAEKAEYTLQWILRSFRRQLRAVEPKRRVATHWATYQRQVPSYSAEEFRVKRAFVEEAIGMAAPKRVLDIGCNEGLFSQAAAAQGASVVAFDQDAGVIGALYQKARDGRLPILPLVQDLGRPTPPHGWRNRERASFLDRSRGSFDLVLGLAVLHHMLVTDGVPLSDAIELFAEFTTKHVLLEYVDPKDAHFQTLLRGRESIHEYLTQERFETEVAKHFTVVRSLEVKAGLRRIYLLKKR
ncbi:MAG: methyltransferase domain-containing protein [Bryobacterales bacterium]|nr:methyltransferase domain-containing protein [Bryobacterales bacterium]